MTGSSRQDAVHVGTFGVAVLLAAVIASVGGNAQRVQGNAGCPRPAIASMNDGEGKLPGFAMTGYF